MPTTPKAVILAVVVFLGLIVLSVVVGSVALAFLDKKPLPDVIVGLATLSAGGMIGLLGSTRSAPDVPPGGSVTTGATTVTGPPSPPPVPPVDPRRPATYGGGILTGIDTGAPAAAERASDLLGET